jgi:hypothetical protein
VRSILGLRCKLITYTPILKVERSRRGFGQRLFPVHVVPEALVLASLEASHGDELDRSSFYLRTAFPNAVQVSKYHLWVLSSIVILFHFVPFQLSEMHFPFISLNNTQLPS